MALCPHFGIAELAHLAAFYFPAELLGHGLHAVADAEYRHAKLKYRLRRARGAAFPYRCGPARQYDARRREFTDEGVGHVVRMQLAIDTGFAHAARNQLRILRAEIEYEDFLVRHVSRDSGSVKKAATHIAVAVSRFLPSVR